MKISRSSQRLGLWNFLYAVGKNALQHIAFIIAAL